MRTERQLSRAALAQLCELSPARLPRLSRVASPVLTSWNLWPKRLACLPAGWRLVWDRLCWRARVRAAPAQSSPGRLTRRSPAANAPVQGARYRPLLRQNALRHQTDSRFRVVACPSVRSSVARRAATSQLPRLAVRSGSKPAPGARLRAQWRPAPRFPQTLADLRLRLNPRARTRARAARNPAPSPLLGHDAAECEGPDGLNGCTCLVPSRRSTMLVAALAIRHHAAQGSWPRSIAVRFREV